MPSDSKWRGIPEFPQVAVLLPGGSEKIRRMMNADGMLVFDGHLPGYARCAEFKVAWVAKNTPGSGSRSQACAHLPATLPSCITLKISQDTVGEIVVHCGKQQRTYLQSFSGEYIMNHAELQYKLQNRFEQLPMWEPPLHLPFEDHMAAKRWRFTGRTCLLEAIISSFVTVFACAWSALPGRG